MYEIREMAGYQGVVNGELVQASPTFYVNEGVEWVAMFKSRADAELFVWAKLVPPAVRYEMSDEGLRYCLPVFDSRCGLF